MVGDDRSDYAFDRRHPAGAGRRAVARNGESNTGSTSYQSGTDWTPIVNNGAGHSTTVVAAQNDVVCTAWCGPRRRISASTASRGGGSKGQAPASVTCGRRPMAAQRGETSAAHTTAMDVQLGPDNHVYAVTHGIWSIAKP
jgi:ribosomal protein L27